MNKTLILFLSLLALFTSCGQRKNIEQLTEEDINKEYTASEWNKLSIKADSGINKRLFVEQNRLNPAAWQAAFRFLTESDFDNMELKDYKLLDDGTYANIAEYDTKDSSHFEIHRRYIDVQYVHKGSEYIRLAHPDADAYTDTYTEVKPYNDEKDIAFFDAPVLRSYKLSAGQFTILFPGQGHMPCMTADSASHVRKVVVKIPYINQNGK